MEGSEAEDFAFEACMCLDGGATRLWLGGEGRNGMEWIHMFMSEGIDVCEGWEWECEFFFKEIAKRLKERNLWVYSRNLFFGTKTEYSSYIMPPVVQARGQLFFWVSYKYIR